MFGFAAANCRPDIVEQHVPDTLRPVFLMQKILTQGRGSHLRNMLVLRDGRDFRFRQPAEGNTILEGNHLQPGLGDIQHRNPGRSRAQLD